MPELPSPHLPSRVFGKAYSIRILGTVPVLAVLAWFLYSTRVEAPLTIAVDMRVESGQFAELFVNDPLAAPPSRNGVTLSVRRVYEFSAGARQIRRLRLDPTEAPGARVEICGITIRSRGRELLRLDSAALAGWETLGLAGAPGAAGCLAFTSTGNDPILRTVFASGLLPVYELPGGLALSRRTVRRALWAVPVLVLILFLPRRLPLRVTRKRRRETGNSPPRPAVRLSRENLTVWIGRGALLATAAAACWSVLLAYQMAARSRVSVAVDMETDRGDSVELFLNDLSVPPYRLEVRPKERSVYVFEDVPHTIGLFRLDPTDGANAGISIYGISVRGGDGRELLHITPGELQGWTSANLADVRMEAGALRFRSTNADPVLLTNVSVHAPGVPAYITTVKDVLSRPDGIAILFFGSFMLFLAAGCTDREGRAHVGLAALVHTAGYLLVLAVYKIGGSPPSVHTAVGFSSFIGYPKSQDHNATFVLLALAVAGGILLAREFRSAPGLYPSPPSDRPPVRTTRERYTRLAVHVVVLLAVATLFEPNLADGLRVLVESAPQHQANWDNNNGFLWKYLIQTGHLPYRDFWYPYGGIFLYMLPFPAGILFSWGHATIVLFLFYAGLYHALGRRLRPALAIFAMVMTALLLQSFPGWTRYMMSAALVLLYAGVDRERPGFRFVNLLLFAGTAVVVYFEPAQFLYAATGMAAHTVLTLVHRYGPAMRRKLPEVLGELRERWKWEGAPMAAACLLVAAVLAVSGQLPNFIRFQLSMNAQAQYGASPVDVAAWMSPRLSADSLMFILVYLIAIGCFELFRTRPAHDPVLAAVVALPFTTFLCLQKQVVRPALLQVFVIAAPAILIYGVWIWRRWNVAQKVIAGIFTGLLLGAAVQGGVPARVSDSLKGAGANLADSYRTVVHHGREIREANAAFYVRDRFRGFGEQVDVLNALERNMGFRRGDKVYVLGDESSFYVLLEQDPPYLTNNYNTSPIFEQQTVLKWLRREAPRFVIWTSANKQFDGVPHLVRIPLLYRYVLDNYAPARAVGAYEILEKKAEGEPVNVAYWRARLGPELYLGHLPALSSVAAYPACRAGQACQEILRIKINGGPPGRSAVAAVSQAGVFQIGFEVEKGRTEYAINLDRLWFWPVLRKAGLRPQLQPSDPGAALQVIERGGADAVLY